MSTAPTPLQIKTTRLMAGLTQAQVAALMGVSRLTVVNWEAGRHAMRPRDYDYFLAQLPHHTGSNII